MSRLDLSTTDGCPDCWLYGPHWDARAYWAQEAHSAYHEFMAVLIRESRLPAVVDRLQAALDWIGRRL